MMQLSYSLVNTRIYYYYFFYISEEHLCGANANATELQFHGQTKARLAFIFNSPAVYHVLLVNTNI